jgi:uncharacterized protein YdeI (YjbR/CyaY-like superfamily)
MEPKKPKYFQSSVEWRRWLENNHDKENDVWLVHYKKASGKSSISHDSAVEEALCFGWIDGKLKSIDNEKFILRYSPRKPRSVWSEINRKRAERLIALGKMTMAGLKKIEEAKKSGLWDKAYTNRIKERMPPDLNDALSRNRDAWRNFRQFANTYRNMYIGWVTGAKTEPTRKKRIKEVVKRSSLNKKPGLE